MEKRELDFRAWDKRFKNMVYASPMAIFNLDDEDHELMQYTGLRCNGQEWYEDDILENNSDWYRIAWDNDQARWLAVGIRSTHESLDLSELLSQETWIQGNIHKNPELLD